MRLTTIIFPALLALAGAPQALAAITLHVSSTIQERTTQVDVTLADSYMAVDTSQGRVIYDFKTRRRFAVNTAAREYVEYSLYDTLGFRVMELQNRVRLQGALAAAKVDAPALNMAVQENELSLLKGAPEAVDEKAEDGMRSYSIGGVHLATWSEAGTKVAADDAAQFARFMRYAQGGHPQLLDKLAKGGVIPDHLSFVLSGDRTLRLDISAVRTAEPQTYDLKAYKREMSSGGLDALFDRIAAMTPAQLTAFRAQYPCDSGADFSEPRALDTMLGKMECTLVTGKPLSLTDEQKEAVKASPTVGLLFAAINPKNSSDAENAVKTLVALRTQAPRKAYMLKVFEANHHARLKQVKEARDLFTDVLQANPVLVGAYKDLGDLLLMQYDSPRAWRSWDTGRRLTPGLSNFEPVNKFEAGMVAQHPEYF
jgi:tryptophan 2,3-dioxygenase